MEEGEGEDNRKTVHRTRLRAALVFHSGKRNKGETDLGSAAVTWKGGERQPSSRITG